MHYDLSGSSPLVRGSEDSYFATPYERRFIPARAGIGNPEPCRHHPLPVHPRSCGDRYTGITVRCGKTGSSPLVRGSDQGADDHQVDERFIPARAGIGMSMSASLLVFAVHPRSCGDR